MSCGNTIADKWMFYKTKLQEIRRASNGSENRFYMDGTQIPRTPEHDLMTKLGFKRPCCRKHFLTHVDLIEKI